MLHSAMHGVMHYVMQVARVALDSMLPPATEPVFVKMDVEGAECAVVRGMHSYLRDSALIIGFAMEV